MKAKADRQFSVKNKSLVLTLDPSTGPRIFLLSAMLILMLVSCTRRLTAPASALDDDSVDNAYKLIWSDEFNIDGPPNEENWNYEIGFIRNEEAQYYQPENAFCENGNLIIEARREPRVNPIYDPVKTWDWKKVRDTAEYTSACLRTDNKQTFQYGRFEMRARIDTAIGLWPAFWTLGIEGEWPGCGEVDILEYYRGNFLTNVCWARKERFRPHWDSERTPISQFQDSTWADSFHVWRMDWTPRSIALYMDDILLNRTALRRTMNRYGPRVNPMQQPHFILINLAIGGLHGGDPSETSFPRRMEVDYVRVYQIPDQDTGPRTN